MSDISDPRLTAYVRDLFAPEDEVLTAIARHAEEAGVAPMEITGEVGQLLHVLAVAVGARRILEIGTLYGYSAIWMARALPPEGEGRLVTIELDPGRAADARTFIARAGLADRVELMCGRALELLPALADEAAAGGEPASYDLAFIDAAKEEYPAYLDWAMRLVRKGGVIAADNTLIGGGGAVVVDDETSPALTGVRAFNERIATDPGLASIIVPVREGVSVSVVR